MKKRTAKNFGLSDSHRVHLFFERSGTFKKAFEKYGFVATDYDLEAEHEEVKKTDLFLEITREYYDLSSSVFAKIESVAILLKFALSSSVISVNFGSSSITL